MTVADDLYKRASHRKKLQSIRYLESQVASGLQSALKTRKAFGKRHQTYYTLTMKTYHKANRPLNGRRDVQIMQNIRDSSVLKLEKKTSESELKTRGTRLTK